MQIGVSVRDGYVASFGRTRLCGRDRRPRDRGNKNGAAVASRDCATHGITVNIMFSVSAVVGSREDLS